MFPLYFRSFTQDLYLNKITFHLSSSELSYQSGGAPKLLFLRGLLGMPMLSWRQRAGAVQRAEVGALRVSLVPGSSGHSAHLGSFRSALLELGSSSTPGSSPRTWSHSLPLLGAELPGTLCVSSVPHSPPYSTPFLPGDRRAPPALTCPAPSGFPRASGEKRLRLLPSECRSPVAASWRLRRLFLSSRSAPRFSKSTSKRRETAATPRPQVRLPHPLPSLPPSKISLQEMSRLSHTHTHWPWPTPTLHSAAVSLCAVGLAFPTAAGRSWKVETQPQAGLGVRGSPPTHTP